MFNAMKKTRLKIKDYFKKVSLFFLVILGASMLSLAIWKKFIRVKLPKEIPLNLSHTGLLVLVYICAIYSIIVITLIIKFKTESGAGITKTISSFIYMPLTTFDSVLKNNKFIYPIYELLLNRAILWYHTEIMRLRSHHRIRANRNTYIMFQLFPRAIMALALAVDVYYFHCLYLIYKVVYVYILVLISRYVKYSFKYAVEQYISRLEQTVDFIETNYRATIELTKCDVRSFADAQTCAFVYDDSSYTCVPNFYNHTDYRTRKDEFNTLMPKIIIMSVFLEEYDICESTYPHLIGTKIAIYSLVLVCWLSVLYMSVGTYDYNDLITNFPTISINLKIEEPFSGLFINLTP